MSAISSPLLARADAPPDGVAQPDSVPGWYAVHTRSNFEKRVSAALERKGFTTYLPLISERHQWKDRKRIVERPLFSGYVFVAFSGDADQQLTILRTAGAARLVGAAGKPERIPGIQIDAVRELVGAGVPLMTLPLLNAGAPIRVRRGPLAGLEGILMRVKNTHRLVVSIDLLSQSVAAEVDLRDVGPVGR